MTVHGPFSVALRSQARALRDTLTVIIEPDERHGLVKREHALHAALPFGPFPEDHRRRNLLAILLFVLDPDHGSKRQLRPSRHVPWNQKDRPVVQHHPLALYVHDPALNLVGALHGGRGHLGACSQRDPRAEDDDQYQLLHAFADDNDGYVLRWKLIGAGGQVLGASVL